MTQLKIKTSEGANLPQYATPGSAGLDLESFENIDIPPKSWRIVGTGLYFEIPEGHEIQIRSRSGLASKGINLMNQPGTIDSDYRGEIKVILHNNTTRKWMVNKGDRIAQAILSPVAHAEVIHVEEISETLRGEKGLGSTGA